jgi:hypothetical protein
MPDEDDEGLAFRPGELAALGVRRVVHAWLYRDAGEVARVAARLIAARDRSRAAGLSGPRRALWLEEEVNWFLRDGTLVCFSGRGDAGRG